MEARDKPVLTMMETIRRMLMQRLQTKRDHMRRFEGGVGVAVCPRIHKNLVRMSLFTTVFAGMEMPNMRWGI